MRKLLRHDIFHFGLLAGIFATLAVVLLAGVVLLLTAPWFVPIGQAPPSPEQIGMLRWGQQGFPIKVPVEIGGTSAVTSTALSLSDVTFDGYSLWVTGSISETAGHKGAVFQVDPRTNKTVNVVDVGKTPRGILFDGQHLWVANCGDGTVSCIPIEQTSSLIPQPGKAITRTVTTTGTTTVTTESTPFYLAFDGENVWATDRDAGALWRLPAKSCSKPDSDADQDSRIENVMIGDDTKQFDQPFGIIFDGTYIWVANRDSNEVMRLDPDECQGSTCKKARIIEVGDQGSQPSNLAYDGKYVWVTLQGTNQVVRIDAETSRPVGQPIPVGRIPLGIAFDGANIWVANNEDESVSRLRGSDGELLETFDTGGAASRIAFDGKFIWITNYSSDETDRSFLTRR